MRKIDPQLQEGELAQETVYVVAYDSFFGEDYDTGIRLVNNHEVIEQTLQFLHRNTTSTYFSTTLVYPALELATLGS